MGTFIKYFILTFFAFAFIGCSQTKEDEPNDSPMQNEYYVKYEATVNSSYFTNNISYTVAIDNQAKTFKSGKSFSETFGPFKKGFKASITADASFLSIAECNVRIYVSRGGEPFTLKASNSGGKRVTAFYTINY